MGGKGSHIKLKISIQVASILCDTAKDPLKRNAYSEMFSTHCGYSKVMIICCVMCSIQGQKSHSVVYSTLFTRARFFPLFSSVGQNAFFYHCGMQHGMVTGFHGQMVKWQKKGFPYCCQVVKERLYECQLWFRLLYWLDFLDA